MKLSVYPGEYAMTRRGLLKWRDLADDDQVLVNVAGRKDPLWVPFTTVDTETGSNLCYETGRSRKVFIPTDALPRISNDRLVLALLYGYSTLETEQQDTRARANALASNLSSHPTLHSGLEIRFALDLAFRTMGEHRWIICAPEDAPYLISLITSLGIYASCVQERGVCVVQILSSDPNFHLIGEPSDAMPVPVAGLESFKVGESRYGSTYSLELQLPAAYEGREAWAWYSGLWVRC